MSSERHYIYDIMRYDVADVFAGIRWDPISAMKL